MARSRKMSPGMLKPHSVKLNLCSAAYNSSPQHNRGNRLEIARTKLRIKENPHLELYQMEDEDISKLDREAIYLLSRLLKNIEEFNELRENLTNLIETHEMTEKKFINLFQILSRSGFDFRSI